MAYPWSANDILTASDLNAVVAALGGTGAWTSYTPSLTQSGSVAKTVAHASYTKIGRLVVAKVFLQPTASGTANNPVIFGLPLTAAFGFGSIGIGYITDASASASYSGVVDLASTTTARFLATGTAVFLGQTGAAFSAALASGDAVNAIFAYQSTT